MCFERVEGGEGKHFKRLWHKEEKMLSRAMMQSEASRRETAGLRHGEEKQQVCEERRGNTSVSMKKKALLIQSHDAMWRNTGFKKVKNYKDKV